MAIVIHLEKETEEEARRSSAYILWAYTRALMKSQCEVLSLGLQPPCRITVHRISKMEVKIVYRCHSSEYMLHVIYDSLGQRLCCRADRELFFDELYVKMRDSHDEPWFETPSGTVLNHEQAAASMLSALPLSTATA